MAAAQAKAATTWRGFRLGKCRVGAAASLTPAALADDNYQ